MLDLIDKATELLRHQVDNRLDGSARATVAARLATLYLMEGEPLAAREVLAETRLPELPESIRQARILARSAGTVGSLAHGSSPSNPCR